MFLLCRGIWQRIVVVAVRRCMSLESHDSKVLCHKNWVFGGRATAARLLRLGGKHRQTDGSLCVRACVHHSSSVGVGAVRLSATAARSRPRLRACSCRFLGKDTVARAYSPVSSPVPSRPFPSSGDWSGATQIMSPAWRGVACDAMSQEPECLTVTGGLGQTNGGD